MHSFPSFPAAVRTPTAREGPAPSPRPLFHPSLALRARFETTRRERTIRPGIRGGGGAVACAVLAIVCWAASSSAQDRYYVNAAATGGGTGLSWNDSFTDLQPALDAAQSSNAEIWVAAGQYRPTRRTEPDDPRSATFQLVDGVSLYGGFAGTEGSVDERDIDANPTIFTGDLHGDDGPDFTNYGENAYHVVTAKNLESTTAFDGLTVTGGHAESRDFFTSRGGGMYVEDAYPEIRNCMFARNLGEWVHTNVATGFVGGSALFILQEHGYPDYPPMHISHSRFTGNKAIGGGPAVGFYGPGYLGTVTYTDCTFHDNIGYGAFSAFEGSHTFRFCAFYDNASATTGSAMYVHAGYRDETVIEHCRFERNTARSGGAVVVQGGQQVMITDSVFVDNEAETGVGALGIDRAEMIELSDCEFRGNSGADGGGANLDAYYLTTLRRCRFVDNTAVWWAGGLLTRSGLVELSECAFENNHAGEAGGGLFSNSPLHATQCTFTRNSTLGNGGGANVYGYGPSSTFAECLFDQNRSHTGGAIYIDEWSETIVDRCHIAGNLAAFGGGVASVRAHSDLRLVNTLIAANQADAYGGGIAGGDGPLTVRNCTVANNTAGALGAGMIVGRNTAVTNSIAWGNVADPQGDRWTDEIAQIDGLEVADIQYCDVQGWSGAYGGEGNIGLNPLFVDPVDADGSWGPLSADFRLRSDSPCINTGQPSPTIDPWPGAPLPEYETDLDGKPRVLCGQRDMGAYEFGVLGDYDCDGLLERADWDQWPDCMGGPEYDAFLRWSPYSSCAAYDFDADADIDLVDFAGLQNAFGDSP